MALIVRQVNLDDAQGIVDVLNPIIDGKRTTNPTF